MADSSKIGATGFTTVMSLQDIDLLVTDSEAPPHFMSELRRLGVEFRLV